MLAHGAGVGSVVDEPFRLVHTTNVLVQREEPAAERADARVTLLEKDGEGVVNFFVFAKID